MAEFGADATGTYQTPNFVTAQGGVQDRSGETLLQTAGSAVQQGFGITAAFKGREFRGEIDAAVQTEIGKQFASKVEPQPADAQEFKDAIERAKQVSAQGGLGARTRTNMLAEKLTREKAGANPLFASVYRQVAQEVLGDYDATLQFMDMAEAAAANQAKASMQTIQDLANKTLTMMTDTGITLPIHPYQMTYDQLLEAQQFLIDHKGDVLESERIRQARKDQLTELQAQASIQASGASIAASNAALTDARGDKLDQDYRNQVSRQEFRNFDYALGSTLIQPLAAGQKIDEKTLREALFLQRQAFSKAINNYPWGANGGKYKSELMQQYDQKEKAVLDLFTGPLSESQSTARLLQTAQNILGLKAADFMSTVVALNAAAPGTGSALVSAATSFDSDINKKVAEETTNFVRIGNAITHGVTNNGDTSALSAQDRALARESSLDLVSSRNPEVKAAMDPNNFGKFLLMPLQDIDRGLMLQGREIWALVAGMQQNDFVGKFPQMDAPTQQELGIRLHAAADQIGAAYVQKLLNTYKDDSEEAQINTETGDFILPDKQLEQRLNSFMDALVVSRIGDRGAPKDEAQARFYFLKKYFGISGFQQQ
jgi:hypothetical protein